MIATLYAAAAGLATPGLRLLLARRLRRGREIAARLAERRGLADTPRPQGPLLWLHAASVGESVSVLPLLAELHQAAPPLAVLFTTGTVTSAALLAQRAQHGGMVHQFVPLDVPRWARRFLDHWRPDLAVFVESEIWPNLLAAARCRGIPTVLLNARLSAQSHARWRRLPGFARALFGGFALVLAQSEGDAARLRALGAGVVEVPGNLKFAAAPLPAAADQVAALRAGIGPRPVWLAASTHPGEDAAVRAVHLALVAHHPALLTVVVPRHPERGAAVAAAMGGLAVTRRALRQGPPAAAGVWVADTLGELGLFYASIGVVFVGGSLVAHGGQNVLEPARLGCAVAVGRWTANFAEPVAALRAAGGLVEVADAAALAAWVDAILRDPAQRAAMGSAAQAVATRDADLPRRIAARLLAMLPAA